MLLAILAELESHIRKAIFDRIIVIWLNSNKVSRNFFSTNQWLSS